MPYLSRDPAAGENTPAHQYPIARSFALVLLGAVLLLVVLRHLFGAVRLEVGTR